MSDYRELVERLRSDVHNYNASGIRIPPGHVEKAADAITSLLDRAEAAESHAERLNSKLYEAGNLHMAAESQVVKLREALSDLWGWVDAWDPEFVQDDEWPETYERVKAALTPSQENSTSG
jgi:hypothetical protein